MASPQRGGGKCPACLKLLYFHLSVMFYFFCDDGPFPSPTTTLAGHLHFQPRPLRLRHPFLCQRHCPLPSHSISRWAVVWYLALVARPTTRYCSPARGHACVESNHKGDEHPPHLGLQAPPLAPPGSELATSDCQAGVALTPHISAPLGRAPGRLFGRSAFGGAYR